MPSPALAKVDDKVSAAALQALQNLTKHTKRCAAFVYEVDPEELGLVNYFDIITEPMHLDLVREKLEKKEYKNVGQYLRDVELVFKNAMIYNPADDKVHKDAWYMCNTIWRDSVLAAFADATALPVEALRTACVQYGKLPESANGDAGSDTGPTKRLRGRDESPPASAKKERCVADEDTAAAKGGASTIRLRVGNISPQPQLSNYGAAALSDKLRAACTSLLRTLQTHPRSELFLTPVDWKALELDDYLTVIKQPMSLQQVDAKLSGGKYADLGSFIADIELIWSNALLYNPPDSFVYEEAMVASAMCRHSFLPQLYSLVESGTVLVDGRVICGSGEAPGAYAASLSSVLTGFCRLHLEGTTRRLFMTEDDPAYPSFKQVQERIDAGAYDSLKQFFGDLRAMFAGSMNRAVPKYMTSFHAMERLHSSLSESLIACIPSARTLSSTANQTKRDAASSKNLKELPVARIVVKDSKDVSKETPPAPGRSSARDSKESTPAPTSRISFKTPVSVGSKVVSNPETPQATPSVKSEKTPASAKVASTPAKQVIPDQLPLSSPLAASNVDVNGLKGWQRQTSSATVEMMQLPCAAELVEFGPELAPFLEKHPDLWCFTEIRNRVLLGKISVPGVWESAMWKLISDYYAFYDDGTPQRAHATQMRSFFQKKLEAIHEENASKKSGGWRPNITRFQALESFGNSDVPDCLDSLRKHNGSSIPIAAHLEFCQKLLLVKLMKHRNAWPFLEPVDPIEHNVPDYFDVVKTPMDFGTISLRLKNNKYSNMTAFISAICLVFDNAILYNGDDSTFGKHAVKLREIVSKDIFDWCLLLPKKSGGSEAAELSAPIEMQSEEEIIEEPGDKPAKGSKHGAAVDNNDETCGICGGDGDLLCCDGPCLRSFHIRCVGLLSFPTSDKWYCDRCKIKKAAVLQPQPVASAPRYAERPSRALALPPRVSALYNQDFSKAVKPKSSSQRKDRAQDASKATSVWTLAGWYVDRASVENTPSVTSAGDGAGAPLLGGFVHPLVMPAQSGGVLPKALPYLKKVWGI